MARRPQRAMLLVWPILLAVAAGASAVPGWAGVGPVVCLLIGAGTTGVLAAMFTLSAERVPGPGDLADAVRNPAPRPAPLAGWVVLGWASGDAAVPFLLNPILNRTTVPVVTAYAVCVSATHWSRW